MWLLYTLIIITVILVILIIFSMHIQDEDLRTGSLLVLLLVGLFGWLIIGNNVTVKTKIEKIPIENLLIIKTKKISIIVVNDEDIYDYDSHWEYLNLNECAEYYEVKEYNMYGGLNSTDLEYRIKE